MNPFKTHGAFSWPELTTSDPAAAAKFYSDVFGWNTETMPMPSGEYTVAKIGNAGHAGIMAPPHPESPTAWMFYITVDDVKACIEKAESLGAKTFLPPMPIPTVGTLAGFQDPQGAHVLVIQYEPEGDEGTGEMPDFTQAGNTPGAFSWFELRTGDPAGAVKFYSDLFGWNITTSDMGAGPYHMGALGEIQMCGMTSLPAPEVPPHWSAYVTVEDLAAVSGKISDAGGHVLMGPIQADGVGQFSFFKDPQGAHLCAIQYEAVEAA